VVCGVVIIVDMTVPQAKTLAYQRIGSNAVVAQRVS
jgi:hypothetical protein